MKKKKEISIMIIDDHQLIIDGIITCLSPIKNINVIAQAQNGWDALEQLKKTQPDVILLDVEMPIINGFDVIKRITPLYPSIKVLVLSTYDEKSIILKMLKAGASGYILKNIKTTNLVAAIEKVYDGGQYLSDEIVFSLAKPSGEDIFQKPVDQLTTPLSKRELEVLQLVAQGLSNTKIGEKLFLSSKTINTHRTNIMKKLGVHNVAELIRIAINYKLIK